MGGFGIDLKEDEETMQKHTWEGDNALEVDMTQEELAEAIRKASRPKPQD